MPTARASCRPSRRSATFYFRASTTRLPSLRRMLTDAVEGKSMRRTAWRQNHSRHSVLSTRLESDGVCGGQCALLVLGCSLIGVTSPVFGRRAGFATRIKHVSVQTIDRR